MNAIVVMSDTMRPDHLGCYGCADVKTPHIDRLANMGMVFTRAYAEYPITIPARTAMVT